MTQKESISAAFFGVRSPLIVDYEVSAERASWKILYAVQVEGPSRSMFTECVVQLDKISELEHCAVLPCAFGPKRRRELAILATSHGRSLSESLIDPTAILPSRVRIGLGGFINAGVVVGGACLIGDGVLVNRSASIGHHCLLSDWVSIGPGAILCGNVWVGEGTMIGAGAVIQSHVRIGANVRIAAGAIVRKDVGDGLLVAGNPARLLNPRGLRSTLELEGQE